MDQELGSIAGFCYKVTPLQIYTKYLPDNFVRPSMYFGPPITVNKPDFLGGYKTSAVIKVKFYDTYTVDAVNSAQTVANAIMVNRSQVPLLNADGTTSTIGRVRINDVEVSEIDTGVAQLTVKWDTLHTYTENTYTLANQIILGVVTKNG